MMVLPVARTNSRSRWRECMQSLGLAGLLLMLMAIPAYIVIETWMGGWFTY